MPPIEHEMAEAFRALAADKLTPVLWRLSWMESRLPEGTTVEVVREAVIKIRQVVSDFNHEASVLASYVPLTCVDCTLPFGHTGPCQVEEDV